ncbi:hypothetical protein [Cardinium endosymbiont of Philonthus spinipes]|uniref:hypothetical protein n=1 Tax=Cardinium endosymbiont of Philonthus spinipes TaxID=3077941 RepID=UPI00313A9F0D
MEKQKSPAARASKESVFPNHLQGVGSISKLFTGAFYHYGHSVEQILDTFTELFYYYGHSVERIQKFGIQFRNFT